MRGSLVRIRPGEPDFSFCLSVALLEPRFQRSTTAMNASPTASLIFVGTPCFGGLVTTNYMMSVLKLMQYAKRTDSRSVLTCSGATPW